MDAIGIDLSRLSLRDEYVPVVIRMVSGSIAITRSGLASPSRSKNNNSMLEALRE
jgi:hypothetical protein